jgi:predicted lipoprotein with Yx(FWY)xxD motif
MHAGLLSRPETTGRRRRARLPFALALSAVTLTAACSAGAYGGTSTAASSAPMPAPNGGAAVVATASTALGTILVDGTGRTIYDFARDTGTMSTCDGSCQSIWPPVAAPAALPASLPGVSGQLGETTRGDGSRQLTIAGHPVYTYAGDKAPGDAKGQGIRLNGGVWNVVSPAGLPVTGSVPSSSAY